MVLKTKKTILFVATTTATFAFLVGTAAMRSGRFGCRKQAGDFFRIPTSK